MFLPALHLDPAGRAGCIASAIVIQRKPEPLRRFQQRQILRNVPAFTFGMEKRHFRHGTPSFVIGHSSFAGTDRRFLIFYE
jgi:hypothetical protein